MGTEVPVTPEEKGLASATEFLKYSLALSTGTLVFSAGLVPEGVAIVGIARLLLMISWVLLGISVALGILAYSRLPVMLAESTIDIHDRFFAVPGALHQIFFALGVVALGAALAWSTFAHKEKTEKQSAVVCCAVCPEPQRSDNEL